MLMIIKLLLIIVDCCCLIPINGPARGRLMRKSFFAYAVPKQALRVGGCHECYEHPPNGSSGLYLIIPDYLAF